MKFAIISPVLPPSPSGQAVVIFKLMQNFHSEDFIAISSKNYTKEHRNQCTGKFECNYVYLPELPVGFKKFILFANYFGINQFLEAYLKKRIRCYQKIFRKYGCKRVIACTADLFEPYAVFNACRQFNIPFYFYIFDDFILQWTDRFDLKFVMKYGPLVIRNADKVIVANECLEYEYKKRYGIESEVIHNPVDIECYSSQYDVKILNSEIKILYTGDVGEAHYDAFRNLIAALEQFGNPNIQIHIYTGRRKARLLKERITGPFVVLHPHQHITSIPQIQQSADILFLPLAFHSKYPEFIINSASPGKMGEFLAAGRPILVHAPPGSFVSWYFKKNGCGLVVDSPDVENLVSAIQKLISDEELRKKISSAAREAALRDFNAESIRAQFKEIVSPNRSLYKTSGDLG